jgi:hypothetical protein
MSAYFPFAAPLTSSGSSTGLGAGLELNLAYARLAALLAPQPSPLDFTRAEGQWAKETTGRKKIRAIEAAWEKMRAEGEKRRSKGKGKAAENWAMDEVAAWIADILVSFPIPSLGYDADFIDTIKRHLDPTNNTLNSQSSPSNHMDTPNSTSSTQYLRNRNRKHSRVSGNSASFILISSIGLIDPPIDR